MYSVAEALAGARSRAGAWLGLFLILFAASLNAAQIDIHGPAGSYAFGTSVTVLPNGNIVVTDPAGPVSNIGAVYLYSPSGSLISTLTGSTANDQVGSLGVTIVGNGNFVVISPSWNNGAATQAGAVTWVNGTSGLNGVVSSSNSLIGTTVGDQVGIGAIVVQSSGNNVGGVTVLSNGNYIVDSSGWNNGVANSQVGAVTWGNGDTGISGPISATNSLIGTTQLDRVGDLGGIALSNGNYVVASPYWNNGVANSQVGAATWGDGTHGIAGPVTAGNSLIGSTADDHVGSDGVTALSNGNYVVASPGWNNGLAVLGVGAATWGNGLGNTTGPVTAGNSLIGTTQQDGVGGHVTALSNGNYVVVSPHWNKDAGAVTWGDGSNGTTSATVSVSNSLIGTTTGVTTGDYVGSIVTALSNGNYVVASPEWNNGTANNHFGAVTWGNGLGGTTGTVSTSNSLCGFNVGDKVGYGGVTGLSNGNYVVSSPLWGETATIVPGAATWGNGAGGTTGYVSLSNSLLATTAGSGGNYVMGTIAALSNGNYVVPSPYANGVGAATWANGTSATAYVYVGSNNSLVGTTTGDKVGNAVTALGNGNYVVASPYWNNGTTNNVFGAVTWGNGNGASGTVTTVSANNSLIGTTVADEIGSTVTSLSDGNYVVASPRWHNGATVQAGAVTLANGRFRLKGTIQPWNSVIGMVANGGASMVFSYDTTRQQLAVGRPKENILSLFTMDQIFAGDFDP